jgi:hypothetical protein
MFGIWVAMITSRVTIVCDFFNCNAATNAKVCFQAQGRMHFVDVPEGWRVTEDKTDRGSYPRLNDADIDQTAYFNVHCPDH